MNTESKLTKNQTKTFGPVFYREHGQDLQIVATVSYDDKFGNGHNSFSITADIKTKSGRDVAGGCCHEEIAKHFPQLAPLIKWNLCSSDGPMHYPGNAVYMAGTKDCNGLEKGEFRQHLSRGHHQANGVPGVPLWELKAPETKEIYSATKPESVTLEWAPYGRTGEGKERKLDNARSCAIWPDATDEDLTAPGLEARLMARLPVLMAEFRAAVESIGFTF
jgi:hypothetical protein